MNDKEIKDLLQGVHDNLEKLKDTGVDVLFLASKKNHGLFSGTMEGIAAMLLWNMIRYPALRLIMELAIKNYPSFASKYGSEVKNNVPAHEIIDNHGRDFEYMIVEKKGDKS